MQSGHIQNYFKNPPKKIKVRRKQAIANLVLQTRQLLLIDWGQKQSCSTLQGQLQKFNDGDPHAQGHVGTDYACTVLKGETLLPPP